MKDQISLLIADVLQELGLPGTTPEVTVPEDPAHGDYTTNVAMKVFRSPVSSHTPLLVSPNPLLTSPLDLALQVKEAISRQLSAISQGTPAHNIRKSSHPVSPLLPLFPILSAIDHVEVAPPGFINVFLSEASLITHLQEVLKQKEAYGKARFHVIASPASRGEAISKKKGMTKKRVMVEYAHPNTHKAFHIGHLRNITTGESIIRLLESQGHRVIRANYQGDVGLHIAKAVYALLHLSPYKEEVVHLGSGRPERSGSHDSPEVSQEAPVKSRVEFLGKAYAAGSRAFEEEAAAKDEIVSLNALIYASAQRLARERGIDPGTTDYLALVKDEYKGQLETVYTIWKETRQWSLDYFETIYKRVGSRYDRYYFESECLAGVDLARDALKKGVLKEDAGAIIFDGTPRGVDTRVFVNSLGLPTYEGKELKLATMETTEFGPLDRLIHVVGPEQASFFQVTFKAEELLGIVPPGVQHHLIYGWVKLKHGKMSSRTGNVVLGEWLLDEAKKAIYTILEKTPSKDTVLPHNLRSLSSSGLLALSLSEGTRGSSSKKTGSRLGGRDDSGGAYSPSQKELIAEAVAVAAVKYAFLKVSTTSEIAFDIEESVNFQGDSGPYLQYTYARCKSVLRKAGPDVIARSESSSDAAIPSEQGIASLSLAMTLNPEERAALRLLTHFPDVVAEAADSFAPSTLCTYLFKLAQAYNLFYAKHSILGTGHLEGGSWKMDEEGGNLENVKHQGIKKSKHQDQKYPPSTFKTIQLRLALTAGTAQVLATGLSLLGIETLEQM